MRTFSESSFNDAVAGDLSGLKGIPKADLHAHASMSCPFETLRGLARNNIEMPPERFKGFEKFFEYIEKNVDPIMERHEHPWQIYLDCLKHMVNDGIVYVELSFDVYTTQMSNITWDEFSERICSIYSHFQSRISVGFELGIPKNGDPNYCLTSAREAISTGLFKSVDFYGPSDNYEMEDFRGCLCLCKSSGLKIKLHTGEFESPDQMLQELAFFEPYSVQHGIRGVEDNRVLELLRNKVREVNVCPTSNIKLSLYKDYSVHPIRRMFDEGLNVTLGTDDYAVFGKSLSEEYLGLYQSGVFSVEELETIRCNGINSRPNS